MKKEEKNLNDRSVFLFDQIRKILNLPTTISKKKNKFKIIITTEKFKIGEIFFKTLGNTEVKIIKSNGIFAVKSVNKMIKSLVKEICKSVRTEAKKNRQLLKEEKRAHKSTKEKKVKEVKKEESK